MSPDQIESRLSIEAAVEIPRIVDFLRNQLAREPRRNGFVVGLSGGVDSALTAALCVQAAGAKNVLGICLPERESQSSSLSLGRQCAEDLGIECITEEITGYLQAMNVYTRREDVVRELFPDFQENWAYRVKLPGDLRESEELNVYRVEVHRPDGSVDSKRLSLAAHRRLSAATNVKQRIRMTRLYEHAESLGRLVCGTTNRSETIQGFFVRHGDGGVDIEPLAHLYKVQVYELSRHLKLPEGVLSRPPSPDTYSAPVSDEEFYFRLPYDVLDRLLACYEADLQPGEVHDAFGMDIELVRRIYRELSAREDGTARLREMPPTLPAQWEE